MFRVTLKVAMVFTFLDEAALKSYMYGHLEKYGNCRILMR